MWRVVVILLALGLSACAGSRLTPMALGRASCENGFASLYFDKGDSSLHPASLNSLRQAARTHWVCPNVRLTVVGLPAPSETSLGGRRAQSVLYAFEAFGLPAPIFSSQGSMGRIAPRMEIYAQPSDGTIITAQMISTAEAKLWPKENLLDPDEANAADIP